jgi:hypothetical protein
MERKTLEIMANNILRDLFKSNFEDKCGIDNFIEKEIHFRYADLDDRQVDYMREEVKDFLRDIIGI